MNIANWFSRHIYLDRVLIALDCSLNAVAGGDEDMTISLRTAIACRAGKRWGRIGCWLLDKLIEPGHCEKQFDTEEAKEQADGR